MKHVTPKFPTSWVVPKAEYIALAKKKYEYCLVIPVINEGKRFQKQLEKLKKLQTYRQVDIIILDGGSTDGSTALPFLKKCHVRTLVINRDTGRLSAQLRMAYAYALQEKYKGIITVDGNNKDSMESMPLFIAGLKEGYDYIQGSRFMKGGKAIHTPLLRTIGIRYVHAPLSSIIGGFGFTDTTNGFRAYSRKFLLHKNVQPFRKDFVGYELLFYLTIRAPQLKLKVKEVPVTRAYPSDGSIPTKVGGFKGELKLLVMLFDLWIGKYHPKTMEK